MHRVEITDEELEILERHRAACARDVGPIAASLNEQIPATETSVSPGHDDAQLPVIHPNSRSVLLSHYDKLFPDDPGKHLFFENEKARENYRLGCVSRVLDGSRGRYRNPDPITRLLNAGNDIEAIESWLLVAANRSPDTERSYRKEVLRFANWAWLERGKAISSIDIEDVVAYEEFLRNPVSTVGIQWVSKKPMAPKRVPEGLVGEGSKWSVREGQSWAPFRGPLSRASIEHAFAALKSLYTYLHKAGYCVKNPLSVRRRVHSVDRQAVLSRALSQGTWRFLYRFIESAEDCIPIEGDSRERLRLLRQANQRHMIFAALYLLGVRLSELVAIKMSDFSRRYSAEGQEQFWLTILGKGSKVRTIPVPHELLDVIAKYRQSLNTFAPIRRSDRQKTPGNTGHLPIVPSSFDDSRMILSASGTKPLSASRLYDIVKDTLEDALETYKQLVRDGIAPTDVSADQLARASTHWMRHTSATHQSLKGVSLKLIKESLGHANYDTTLIYSHTDNDEWAESMGKFNTY